MHRIFHTTTRRRQTSLEGMWDFVADPQDVGLSEGWYSDYPLNSLQMWVPGVWNTTRELLNYEGPGWFRTRITTGMYGRRAPFRGSHPSGQRLAGWRPAGRSLWRVSPL